MKALDYIKSVYISSMHKAPMEIKEHWEPYWRTFNQEGRLFDDIFEVVNMDSYNIGDIVPVLKLEENIFFYTIVRHSRARGNDHIVTPSQWDLELHHMKSKQD